MITIADSFMSGNVSYLFSCRKGDFAMGSTIVPVQGQPRLQVAGDIDTALQVPFEDDDRFLVAISNGILVLAEYDEELRCAWSVARGPADLVSIKGEHVTIDGGVDWICVSLAGSAAMRDTVLSSLPLFPELDRHAA
jgi:hypothetical protein